MYVSREKRPGYQHHKKAGAMNALVKHSSERITIYIYSFSPQQDYHSSGLFIHFAPQRIQIHPDLHHERI